MKKLMIAAAVSSVLGVSTVVHADIISMDFAGQFTLGNASGSPLVNGDSSDPAGIPTVGSQRTPVAGTFTFDTVSGVGSGVFAPFSFSGGGVMTIDASFQAIGDGAGGSGSLIASQMSYDWNGTNDVPLTAVLDAAGFFANLPTSGGIQTIGTGCTGCAISTTPAAGLGSPGTIGAVPMAMTNFNTNGTTLGDVFPLVDDGISGSPSTTAPITGFHFGFDFTLMTSTGVVYPPVPIPAAVWLFGSGFLGLIGVARRHRRH